MKEFFSNIKLGLSLVKYGFDPKKNLILAIIIFAIGVAVEIASKGSNIIGAFYMLLCALFIYQMIVSLSLSTMVQTSKLKKPLQTTIPAVTSFAVLLIAFTIIAIERVILSNLFPELAAGLENSLFTIVLILLAVFIYTGLVYKHFVISTALLLVVVMGISIMREIQVAINVKSLGLGVTIALGYIVIILGTIIEYLISKAVYKHELSKFAFKGVFGKMQ